MKRSKKTAQKYTLSLSLALAILAFKQSPAKAFFPRMGQKEEEEGEQVKKIKPSKVNQRNMCLCINIKKSLYELGKKRRKRSCLRKRERIPKRSRVDCLLGCVIKSNSQSCQSSFLLIHFLLFFFCLRLFFFFTRV